MKKVVLIFSVCLLFFSCSSDDDSQPENQSETNFYGLVVGNSWVYKYYSRNPNTDVYDIDVGVTDSISVIGTEEFLGNTYFKVRRLTTGNDLESSLYNSNGESFELLRESEGNLIDSDGVIRFTNNDYSPRLIEEQDWGDIYERLIENEIDLTIEAGTFTSVYSERYVITTEEVQLPGTSHNYYSEGIGLIMDTTTFVTNPTHVYERRLVSYVVQ